MLLLHHSGRHRAAGDTGAGGRPHLGLTLVSASLCIFMIQLDFFALNLALPTMAAELHTTTTNMQWVISGYMLAVGAFLIPGGRLGDIVGRKRMLMIGIAGFGACSLGAGLASTASVVIVFRILQGVAAGIMFPLGIAVITAAYPPQRTMRAIGNAYGIGAVAEALGPMFGGGLTELLGWRIVLLVNVPAAVAALVVVAVGVSESRDTTVPRTLDLPGLVAVVLGVAAVTYAVDRAADWHPAATIGIALAGLLILAAFVFREKHTRWPLVSLDLFRNIPYVIVTFMAMAANVAFVVATFVTTIYLQRVRDYSPLEAGLIFLAASVAAGIAGPLSGRLGERYNIPDTIAIASLVGAVGLFVLSFGGGLGRYMPALALVGIGYGIGWAMASVGTQTVVPPERAGQASGVTLAIVVGMAGLAVAAAATLIEVGMPHSGSAAAGIGASIELLLRWLAVASAVAAVVLGMLARRLIPRAHRP
ncbi:MAG: MFS transporter [Actinopolymorphaceae bacterium]